MQTRPPAGIEPANAQLANSTDKLRTLPNEPTEVVRRKPAPALLGADPRVTIAQVTRSERSAYVAQLTRDELSTRLAVRQSGEVIGALQFQVSDGRIVVNVGQVLDLFEGRMDSDRFASLRGSRAAEQFVSLERLRDAGVPLSYSAAYDELVLAAPQG